MLGVLDLLGRHEGRRPEGLAFQGQAIAGARAIDLLGQPEIGELGDAPALHIVADQDVRRLDVAMDDVHLVHQLEGPAELQGELARLAPGQAPLLIDQPGEGAAVDQLHDLEVHPAIEAAIIDMHHVGMVDLRRELRLALEARDQHLVGAGLGAEHLDRHAPADRELIGGVDQADAAGSEAVGEPAVADLLARQGIAGGAGDHVDQRPAMRTGQALADHGGGSAELVAAVMAAQQQVRRCGAGELAGGRHRGPMGGGRDVGHGRGPLGWAVEAARWRAGRCDPGGGDGAGGQAPAMLTGRDGGWKGQRGQRATGPGAAPPRLSRDGEETGGPGGERGSRRRRCGRDPRPGGPGRPGPAPAAG